MPKRKHNQMDQAAQPNPHFQTAINQIENKNNQLFQFINSLASQGRATLLHELLCTKDKRIDTALSQYYTAFPDAKTNQLAVMDKNGRYPLSNALEHGHEETLLAIVKTKASPKDMLSGHLRLSDHAALTSELYSIGCHHGYQSPLNSLKVTEILLPYLSYDEREDFYYAIAKNRVNLKDPLLAKLLGELHTKYKFYLTNMIELHGGLTYKPFLELYVNRLKDAKSLALIKPLLEIEEIANNKDVLKILKEKCADDPVIKNFLDHQKQKASVSGAALVVHSAPVECQQLTIDSTKNTDSKKRDLKI